MVVRKALTSCGPRALLSCGRRFAAFRNPSMPTQCRRGLEVRSRQPFAPEMDQIFLRVSELPMRISAIAGIELALYLTVSVFLLPLLLVAQF